MDLIDLVFNTYRELYKLTEDEFDKVLEKCSEEEMSALLIDE